MMVFKIKLITAIFSLYLHTQIGPSFGLRKNPPEVYALINANIVQNSSKMIKNGIIIIRDGIIENVGKNIKIPADAYIIDLKGKWVYPGFIEPYLVFKSNKQKTPGAPYEKFKNKKQKKGTHYWNEKINPQKDIVEEYYPDEKLINEYLKLGFTSALFVPQKGIFKGKSALFSLRKDKPTLTLIKKEIFEHIGFEYNSTDEEYPNSLMGAIALIRQVFYDAIWHKRVWEYYEKNKNIKKPEFISNLKDLEPFMEGKKKIIFETKNDIDIYRVKKIAKEFNLDFVILGSGYEYRQIEALKNLKNPLILPINYPKDLKFETPEEAIDVNLEDLEHFKYAPFNPYLLYKNKIDFALTTYGLKDPSEFYDNLREAIKRGLPEGYALKALTEIPAKLFSVYDKLGSIEKGKFAHLLITDGKIFNKGTQIYEVFVDGKRIILKEEKREIKGKWKVLLRLKNKKIEGKMEIRGKDEKLNGNLVFNEKKIRIYKIKREFNHLIIVFKGEQIGYKGFINLTGQIRKNEIKGKGLLPDGEEFEFYARYEGGVAEEEKGKEYLPGKYPLPELKFPPGAFGYERLPERPKYILIKNAVLWTASKKGILKNYDMLIKEGKIVKIAKNIKAPSEAVIIDAQGKHVTPGIIDPHSHIAVSGGIAETGDAITSEVRIEDVLNPYDIDIYRELSGGVTTSAILHGSPNPIGGQCIVIKHRWGVKNPEDLIYKKAKPLLKFALGENPKQSNWDIGSKRYPKTRMGVREIIRDRFLAALDYEREKMTSKIPVRKNLELDAILEVLKNRRYAWVHAYRQDEILMFIELAKEFGIKNVSFQHTLEGYKIADKIKEAGFTATTFSDWWAYKFEAYDAIPYGAALMNRVGVITSLHSDFSVLARRLNTEAEKTIKYGNLSPEEAIKLITIYPAIQLGIDKYVGSLEEGKEADFVIWDSYPLSPFSKVLQTWIEGRKYFDREIDLKMRERDKKEKMELVNYYIEKKKKKKFFKFKTGVNYE